MMRVTSSGKYQKKEKMASFVEEENSACRALRVHYSLLAEGIQDPERLACDLYSSSVVSQEVLAAVSMMPQTPLQQKMKLLDGVRCAVAVDEATFPLFVEALKDRPELARLAEMLEALYSPPVQSAQQSLGVARQTLVFKSSTESQAHLPAGAESLLTSGHLPDLQDDLFPVRDKWYDIGLRIGLTCGDLDVIKAQYRDDFKDCLREMLKLRLSRARPLNAADVIAALRKPAVGERGSSIAQDLEHKCGVPTTCHLPESEQPPPSTSAKVEPLTEDMQTYASYLKSVYTKPGTINYDKWPHVTSEKYTNLALIGKQGRNREESERFTKATIHGNIDDILFQSKAPMSMDEVACNLEDGSLPKCVLVEGAPGVGKSTFAWELCGKWGKAEMLQQYKLVVLLRLREKKVKKAKTVEELFRYHNKHVRQAVVEEIEQTGGKGVLLLLEGYDELPVKERSEDSFFMSVIKGDELPEATILVTSRHSASDTLHSCHKCRRQISQHVEIIGFTKDDINAYLEASLSGDSEFRSGIRKYLECYPHIHSMMYIPLNSAIVVEVYRNCKKDRTLVPKTMTELYFSLICSLLLRYLKEHPEYSKMQWNIRSFSDLPPKVFKQFCEVSRIAYDNFFNDQQVIFSDLPDGFNSLGLMQCVPELYVDQGTVLSYNFPHLTVQEFLTAFHMSQLPVAEQVKAFSELVGSKAFNVVLRFIAGLTKFADVPSESLQSIFHLNDCLSLDALHWIFETQDDISRLVSVVARDNCCEVGSKQSISLFRYLRPFDAYVLGYCTAHSNCTWKYNFLSFGEQDAVYMLAHGASQLQSNCNSKISMLYLKFERDYNTECARLPVFPEPLIDSLMVIALSGFTIDDLFTTLSNSTSLTKVGLRDCVVSGTTCKALFQMPTLEELQLEGLCESEVVGTQHLRGNSSLKALGMIGCKMSAAEAGCLATAFQDNTTLEVLLITSCTDSVATGNELSVAFSKTLSQNTTLKYLTLRGSAIGSVGASCLAKTLCHNHTVEALDIAYNAIGSLTKSRDGSHTQEPSRCVSDGISDLAKMLSENTSLKDLEISSISMSPYEVQHVVNALHLNQTLQLLNLSSNAIGDSGANGLADMLTVNKTLEKLYINSNAIGHGGVAALASVLAVSKTLKNLDISFNAIGDEGAIEVASVLTKNETLEQLNICHNAISGKGATALASMLTVNETLQEVNFTYNAIGVEGATALGGMLIVNKTLKQLNVNWTELCLPGTLKLIDSLTHNTTLEKLEIKLQTVSKESVSFNEAYQRNKHRIHLHT